MEKISDTQKMKKVSGMIDLVAKSKGTMIAPREIINQIERLAPEAVNTLEDLMLNSSADSVKLKAALEVLALSGISKETKIKVSTEVQDLDDSSLNTRLTELLGRAEGVAIAHFDDGEKDISDKAELISQE